MTETTTNRSRQDEFLPTRQSLLSRLRAWDDQESWNTFFQRYGRLIFDVAVKAGLPPAEAEDVVQETVISVAKEMPGFKYDPARGSFKGWLLMITRRRIADHFRKKPREQSVHRTNNGDATSDLLENAVDAEATLDRVWDEEWHRHLTQTAIERVKQQVSARQYQIFDFHVLQQMSTSDVTKALGVNIGQIYLAKHRISRLLQKEIRKLEVSLHS